MNKKNDDKGNMVWRFFSSLKLTIFLLIIIAAASILGTFIPQRGQGAMEFARHISPETFRVLSSLDLFDMYHSLWFRIILLLLALNLVVCSIDRFPKTLKRFRANPRPDRKKVFEDLPEEQSFFTTLALHESSDRSEKILNRRFSRISSKSDGNERYFYGEKGRYSHFGVYLVHLSVLLILAGGLIGSFFGFQAHVTILEGELTDRVTLRKDRRQKALDFKVGCDKFHVDFYESGAPREYRSDLSFYVDGKKVASREVLVNHPVEFMGVTFYQSTYGRVPSGRIALSVRKGEGDAVSFPDAELERPYQLPGGRDSFRILDLKPEFMKTGAAALVSAATQEGSKAQFWIFENPEMARKVLPEPMLKSPRFDPSALRPYSFKLDSVETRFYTGLQANRDPGVPAVWAGFIMMIAGFFLTFFYSHRRFWIRLSSRDGGTFVEIAGNSNKNPIGAIKESAALSQSLRAELVRDGITGND